MKPTERIFQQHLESLAAVHEQLHSEFAVLEAKAVRLEGENAKLRNALEDSSQQASEVPSWERAEDEKAPWSTALGRLSTESVSPRSSVAQRVRVGSTGDAGSSSLSTGSRLLVDKRLALWPIWAADSRTDVKRATEAHVMLAVDHINDESLGGGQTIRSGDAILTNGVMQRFVARPNSLRRVTWDSVSCMIMAYDVLFIPLQAFDLRQTQFSTAMEWASTVFWTLDLFSSFFFGFHDGGLVEMRPCAIATRYLKSWLVPNLIVVTIDWILIASIGNELSQNFGFVHIGKGWRLVRILRMVRLVRLMRVLHFIGEFNDYIRSDWLLTALRILKMTFGVVLVNHFLACGWYAVGNMEFLGFNKTWVLALDDDVDGHEDMSYRYMSSLHWSLSQFTPASMEVVPRNTAERTYTICVIIFALVMFSSFVSSITSAMTHLHDVNMQHARQQEYLRRYICDNKVSLHLGRRIYEFVRQHCSTTKKRIHESDVTVFKVLPESLRVDLRCEVFVPVLLPHPFFNCCHKYDRGLLSNICRFALSEVTVSIGQELFSHGMEATHMFFITSGELDYFFGSCGVTRQVSQGDWICEMVLWVPWEHQGRLVAGKISEVVTLNSPALRHVAAKAVTLYNIRRYAHQYLELLHTSIADDLWGELDDIQERSTEAFNSVRLVSRQVDSPKRSRRRAVTIGDAFQATWQSLSGIAGPRTSHCSA